MPRPPIVAIDNGRAKQTPCRAATRQKNLGYGEATAGDSVQTQTEEGRKRSCSFATHCCRWPQARPSSPRRAPQAPARAEDSVKIGLILPMTGGQASTGKQIDNAIKLYMKQHGDTVAGKKIEVILKDDGAVPDNTKPRRRN